MGKCCCLPSITPAYHGDIHCGFHIFYIFDLISFMHFHFTIFSRGWLFTAVFGEAVGKFPYCNMSVFVFLLCHARCSRCLWCSQKANRTDRKPAASLIKSCYLALHDSEISVIQMFLSLCSFPLPFVSFSFLVLFHFPDSWKWTLRPPRLVISPCPTFLIWNECRMSSLYASLSLKVEIILGIGTELWNLDWGRCLPDGKRLSLMDSSFIYQHIFPALVAMSYLAH